MQEVRDEWAINFEIFPPDMRVAESYLVKCVEIKLWTLLGDGFLYESSIDVV